MSEIKEIKKNNKLYVRPLLDVVFVSENCSLLTGSKTVSGDHEPALDDPSYAKSYNWEFQDN